MIRPILRYGERPLHQPAAEVATFDEPSSGSSTTWSKRCTPRPGIGLAATQLGVPLRVFVVDVCRGRERRDLIVMINPTFVEREGMQLEEEGCLSVPGFNATVVRPPGPSSAGSIATAPSRRSKARRCSRARFSTRWIISRASSSSIASAASSATSSCGESRN